MKFVAVLYGGRHDGDVLDIVGTEKTVVLMERVSFMEVWGGDLSRTDELPEPIRYGFTGEEWLCERHERIERKYVLEQ